MTHWATALNDSLELKTDTLTFARKRSASERKQLEKAAKEREKNEKELKKLEEKLAKLRQEGKEDTTDVEIEVRGLRDMLTVKPKLLNVETNKNYY